VILDLGDTAPATARRISLSPGSASAARWSTRPRFFVSLSRQPNARTCASLVIECARASATWTARRASRACCAPPNIAPTRRNGESNVRLSHGQGNLIAIAGEFSPPWKRRGPTPSRSTWRASTVCSAFPRTWPAAIAQRARETGARATLALAANPDAAICAARGFRGVQLIPHGDEASFSRAFPVTLLDPTPDLLETLERWGHPPLRGTGRAAAARIAERLGAEGLRLRALARGEAERKLLAVEDPLRFEDELDLEYPVERSNRWRSCWRG